MKRMLQASEASMASITEFPFVEQIEDEAMALLLEARDALSDPDAPTQTSTTGTGRLMAAHRNFEVTARLSWVVAWVLYQKAVRNGELSPEDANARHPPLDMPRDPAPGEDAAITADLQDRLVRCRALYDRAAGFEDRAGAF